MRKVLVPALLALFTVAVLVVRLGVGPSGTGYRVALAAAPGGAYLAEHGSLRLLTPSGSRVLAPLPEREPLSLAVSAGRLLLGGWSGLYVSDDAGGHWHRVPVAGGRFVAVAAKDELMLAGAWGSALWRSDDGGASWARASTPAGDVEVNSLGIGEREALAGTLLGLLVSGDGGRSWTRAAGVPSRVSAVTAGGDVPAAATWAGTVYELIGDRWHPASRVSPAVWALSGDGVAATGFGLESYPDGVVALRGREVTSLARGEGGLYAVVAGGSAYLVADGAVRTLQA